MSTSDDINDKPQLSAIPVPTQDEGGTDLAAKKLELTEVPPDDGA